MRFTTNLEPLSTSVASRPKISTWASIGIVEPGGSACSTTLNDIVARTRVPPCLSLLFAVSSQFTLIPAVLITPAHLIISFWMNSPNALGVLPTTTAPFFEKWERASAV